MSQRTHKITTRRTMRKLHKGDKFYINGVEMTAGEDAHLIANDASDDDGDTAHKEDYDAAHPKQQTLDL